jgi:hypothetical protein
MRQVYFLSAMLFTIVLCVSGIGLAAAEPQKNQIEVDAVCKPDRQMYTFVINGMSKTGHVTDSTEVDVPNVRNVVVKQFTVKYYDLQTRKLVGSDEFDSGNKEGLQDDLIQCSGTTQTVLQGLGPVKAVYDFQAFVTPTGKA